MSEEIKIEKAVALEKGKCYLFKVGKMPYAEIRALADALCKKGIEGIIYVGDIEVIIPKKEKEDEAKNLK
jgi:hypothetical protein